MTVMQREKKLSLNSRTNMGNGIQCQTVKIDPNMGNGIQCQTVKIDPNKGNGIQCQTVKIDPNKGNGIQCQTVKIDPLSRYLETSRMASMFDL